MKRISLFILFFFLTTTPLLALEELSEKDLIAGKEYYSKMSYLHKEDIEDIFDSYPIYTNVYFRIRSSKDNILDKMFTDLYYTGQVGKTYANSPYTITRDNGHYRAQIQNLVDGNIYPLKSDRRNNHYVYLVKGVYDTFITLRGKMVVDIRYKIRPHYVEFFVKAYIIIDNTYMWRLARYLKSLPAFQQKIDQLIQANVRSTIRLGIRTVEGIKKDLKGKNF